MNGGCACGQIRYRLASTPGDTGWCHCRLCQKASGSPAMVFTTLPRADFLVQHGADLIGEIALTDFGRRRFARCCGTPLAMTVDWQPGMIDVAAASLDDPEAVPPGFHIYYADRIGWAPAADDRPRYDDDGPDRPRLCDGAERPNDPRS